MYVLEVIFTTFVYWASLNMANRLGYVRSIWPAGLGIAFALLSYRLVGWTEWRVGHVLTIVSTGLVLWVLTLILRVRRPRKDRPP